MNGKPKAGVQVSYEDIGRRVNGVPLKIRSTVSVVTVLVT